MTACHPTRLLAAATSLALVASLLAPLPALAEESLPPADPTPEAAALPGAAEPAVESAPPSEATPVPTGAPPATGEVAPAEGAAPGDRSLIAEAPSPDLAEVLEAAPEGTSVAVVGEDGDLLPLASVEAGVVAEVADPIWCPASVKAPTPNLNGCSDWFPSMTALVGWLSDDVNEPAMDGVIWIEQGSHGDGATLTLDGNLAGDDGFDLMSAYKLTLRGGWSGNPGDKTITTDNPSEFHVRLQVVDWANDVTLSDILITNAPVGDALVVTTSGNITLTRVQSSNNTGRGARLDNTSATTAKSVTISDSQFNENGATGGLAVRSEGAITLANVTAGWIEHTSGGSASHGNVGYGAYLENNFLGASAGVKLTGINTFSGNSGTGLEVHSNGPITGNDLTASENSGGGSGAYLVNDAAPSAAGVTLTGTNIFSNNASTGLYIATLGPIKLSNLQAHSSASLYGANLQNEAAASAQPVTLAGSNSFKGNYSTGLRIRSNGAITLNNITASGSLVSAGASVTNNYSPYTSPVTFTGVNQFNDNYNGGLGVTSFGAIKAANLTANRNGLDALSGNGLSLNNSDASSPQVITLTGATTALGNYGLGVYLRSRGAVSIQNLTANDSAHERGALINNIYGDAASAQKVTLSGAQAIHGNYGTGLQISSYGAIIINGLAATGNGLGTSGGGAWLSNSTAAAAQKVTLTGTNTFSDNDGYGLTIDSLGAIAAANLTARDNGSSGASLDNSAAPTPQPVSLTGKNLFAGNLGDGLYVNSDGALSLASLTVLNNLGYGAFLSNRAAADSPQKISLTGTHLFQDNANTGLTANSYGPISLSTTSATGNGIFTGSGNGISLNNANSAKPQPITLSGSFTLDGNHDRGMFALSWGAIKASNLTARGNLAIGVMLVNSSSAAPQPISLSGTNRMLDNAYDGLYVESLGAITISNLNASGNGLTGLSGSGASLYNAVTTPQKVTLTGVNSFNNNWGTGLQVTSLGAITASNLSASGNSAGGAGYGAELYNSSGGAAGGITLSGASEFDGNARHGLYASSLGAIALNTTRIQALGNGLGGWGSGIELVNASSPAHAAITIKGTNTLSQNRTTGLYASSDGPITVSSLTASGNGTGGNGYGALLDNDDDLASAGGVTLSGTNTFTDNANYGLFVYSRGAISVSNLTASDNGILGTWGSGAALMNFQAATPLPIKLTGFAVTQGNQDQGLSLSSVGAISLTNVNASGNGSAGATLSNSGSGATVGIALTGTNTFSDNGASGLSVNAHGPITISSLTASGNGTAFGEGAYLDNTSASTPQAVKLTGYATFADNHDSGVSIYSGGAISIANLTARGNLNGTGASLDNSGGTAAITLTGANVFTGNGGQGLYVSSSGPVSLTRVTADGNLGSGLYFNLVGSLMITCGSFVNNGVYGLWAGAVDPMLIGVFASGNPSGDLMWSGGVLTSDVRACPLN